MKLTHTIGDCECCEKTNVEIVHVAQGNMMMCNECKVASDIAVAHAVEANKIIQESRQIDGTVQIKTDVFLVKSVAATELYAAIMNDANIPDADKDYVMAKECQARREHLQRVIFEQRQALNANENEERMWHVNAQSYAGKLRAELRDQFKGLDVNYAPTPIKKQNKTTKPVKSVEKVKFSKYDLYQASNKYNVPANQVQMIVESRKISPEQAAKELAQMMGIL